MSAEPKPARGYGYEEFVAEYYDHLPVTMGRLDVNFYVEQANAQGDPVLELGCGTGRVLLPMARAGHRVTGLDLSGPMLGRAKKKLETEPLDVRGRVKLVQGDMTEFDLGERFRLVTIPFRPFQHLLTVEAQMACLHCAHGHLANGGMLAMDFFQTDPRRMHDPTFLEDHESGPEVKLPNGSRLQLRDRTVAFHRAEQQNDVEMFIDVVHADGKKERLVHTFTVRYFFRYEVEHLLARCGFRVAEVFGNFTRAALRDDSPDMIFVAEKV